jgi:hypothetical protein
MSGQLIFPNSVDVIQLSSFNYVSPAIYLQPQATRLITKIGDLNNVTVPPAVTDIFLSSVLTVTSDDPITISDLMVAIIWSGVPAFLTNVPTPLVLQFSCDRIIEPGVFYTGGTGIQTFTSGVVLGPNAAALAPLMSRNESQAFYSGTAGPGLGGQIRGTNGMTTTSPCISAPGTLPSELRIYYQATTSANFLASTNASITIQNRVYGILQA